MKIVTSSSLDFMQIPADALPEEKYRALLMMFSQIAHDIAHNTLSIPLSIQVHLQQQQQAGYRFVAKVDNEQSRQD